MRSRWLYFTLFVILASQGRFISLVMHDSLKFSDSQVGIILGLGVLASMIATPAFSRRSDGTEGCLMVLKKLSLWHFLFFGSLGLIGLIGDETARLVLAVVSRFLASGAIAPTGPILDAYNLKTLDDKDMYGRERLWGAVSWALASILMGICMDIFESPLYISLVYLVVGTSMFLALLRYMPDERSVELEKISGGIGQVPSKGLNDQHPRSASLWHLWRGKPTIIVFFYIALVMGAATSIVENLLFLFMRQDLKASYTLCGVSVVITVLFEIPLFFVGKSLLAKVGVLKLLLIGMFCYISRVVCYTVIDIPWTVLLIEPFHGLTYATIQTAAVAFIHSKSPKDRIAEAQGAYTMVKAFGQLLGTVIGSDVLEQYGSKVMYRAAAVIVTFSGIVLVVVFHCFEDGPIAQEEALLPTVEAEDLEQSSISTQSAALHESAVHDVEMRQLENDETRPIGKDDAAYMPVAID